MEEEGRDEGGLSAEMFSSFFREMLRPEAGLFEPAADAEGGGLLPRSDAPEEDMETVGRVIVKALIDDHPLGHGLAPVALEFLCGMHEESFATVAAALAALRHFDPTLADNWASLLAEPAAQAGWLAPPKGVDPYTPLPGWHSPSYDRLAPPRAPAPPPPPSVHAPRACAPPLRCTRRWLHAWRALPIYPLSSTPTLDSRASLRRLTVGDFPAEAHEAGAAEAEARWDEEAPLTPEIAAAVITRACRCRLVGERQGALLALRRGFTEAVDLQLQLAPLSRTELAFMLQARTVRVHVVRVAQGVAWLSTHACCLVVTPRRARRRSRPPSCSPASCCPTRRKTRRRQRASSRRALVRTSSSTS